MTAQMAPLVFVMAEIIRPQPGHRLIFAYDLLMEEAGIRSPCPEAQFISTARVLNRQFVVNSEGAFTSVRRDGYAIHGIVWEITERESIHLEEFLGFPKSVDRFGAFARSKAGNLVAVEYFASANHRHGEGHIDDILMLMAVAETREFPESYRHEILSWGPSPFEPDNRPRLVR